MNPEPTFPPRIRPPSLRWGLGPTLGFFAGVLGAYLLAQGVAVGALMVFRLATTGTAPSAGAAGKPGGPPELDMVALQADPALVTAGTLAALPVVLILIMLFVSLRRTMPIGVYLGLGLPRLRDGVRWVCILMAYFVFLFGVNYVAHTYFGRPEVSEFMAALYAKGAGSPWLHLAVIVAAPLSEEFLFRGFLFSGLAESRVGPVGAAVISSGIWTLIHIQYDAFDLAQLFLLGLLLAGAWWKSRSLWLCVILHAIVNLSATIEMLARSAAR